MTIFCNLEWDCEALQRKYKDTICNSDVGLIKILRIEICPDDLSPLVYYFRLPDDTIELFGYVKTKVHWREHPDIPELKLAQYSIKPKLFNHKGKIYYARRSRVKSFTWGIGKLSVRGIGNQQTTASEISLKKIILSKKAKDTTNVKIHSDNVYTTDGVVYAFGVRVGFFHDNEAVIMNPAIRKLLSQGGEWKIRAL